MISSLGVGSFPKRSFEHSNHSYFPLRINGHVREFAWVVILKTMNLNNALIRSKEMLERKGKQIGEQERVKGRARGDERKRKVESKR